MEGRRRACGLAQPSRSCQSHEAAAFRVPSGSARLYRMTGAPVPPYDPAMMVALLLYALGARAPSSRQVAQGAPEATPTTSAAMRELQE